MQNLHPFDVVLLGEDGGALLPGRPRRKLAELEDAGVLLSLAPRADSSLPPLKRARVSAPFVPLAWDLSRPPCAAPSLDSLEDGCLVEILSRLDADRDRSAAACVSKRWLRLLAGRVVRPSPKKPELDLNLAALSDDVDDPTADRCFEGPEATDLSLFAAAVGGRGRIGKLSIRSSAVTDLGLAAVARLSPSLRSLSLWNAAFVTDKGLSLVAERCPLLEKLDLCGCPLVSDKGVTAAATKCRRLSSIAIERCPKVGDDCLWAVGHFCTNLGSISIIDSPMVGDKGVASLLSSSSSPSLLKKVVLRRLGITDLSAAIVGHYGKSISELVFADLPGVSERGLWAMGCAGGLQRLESLTLAGSWATDLGLEAVARGCQKLKQLSVRRTDGLTDAGLQRLAASSSSLESLRLEECSLLTLSGVVEALISLSESLRSLSLVRCRGMGNSATCPVLEKQTLPSSSLRSLTVSHCTSFGDAELVSLGKLCKNVQRLSLSGLPKVTDVGLLQFLNESSRMGTLLKKVNLSSCMRITDAAVTALSDLHGKSLRVLILGDCKKITDASLVAISKYCVCLKEIDLSGCAVSDGGVAALAASTAGCGSLGILSLAGCTGVSGSSLIHLGSHCGHLQGLNLQLCLSLTGQDVNSFHNRMERCDVLF